MKLRSCVITPPTSGSDTSQYTLQIIPRSGAARLDWLRHALRQSANSQHRDFVFSQVTEPGFWEPVDVPQLGINAISNHIDVFTEEQQKILQDCSKYPLRLATGRARETSVTRSEDSHPSRRRKVHRIGSLVHSGGYITVGSSRRVGTGSKEERSKGRALKRKVREQQRKKQDEIAKAVRITEPETVAGESSTSMQSQAGNPANTSTPNRSSRVPRVGETSTGRGSSNGVRSVEVDYSVDSPVIVCPALEEHADPPSSAMSSPAAPKEGSAVLPVASNRDKRTDDQVEDTSEKKRAVLAKKQELLQKQIDLQRLILRRRRESSPPAPAVQTRPPPALPKRTAFKGSSNAVARRNNGVSPEEALRRVREMKSNRGDCCSEKAPEEMSELDKFEKCKAEVMAKKQKAEEEKSNQAAKDGGSPASGSDVVDEEPWFVKVRALAPGSPTAAITAPALVHGSAEEREKALIGIVLEERYKGSSGNSDIFGDGEESDNEYPLPSKSSPTSSPPALARSADDDLDFDENEFLRLDYSDS